MFTSRVNFRLVGSVPVIPRAPTASNHVTRLIASASVFRFCATPRRSYATPGRPKKGSIGESSPRAKRTVKKDATSPPKTRTIKTSATAEKKAAATKARAEREQVKKAKEREKLAAKKLREKQRADKKKTLAKKVVKKPQKVLTEEQQERVKAKKVKADIKALKVTALSPPATNPGSAWTVLFSERMKDQTGKSTGRGSMAAATKAISNEYKNLSPAQMEHYNHIANQARSKAEAEFAAWVQSHTPEQIRLANFARTKLHTLSRRDKTAKRTAKWSPIKDDRQLKVPAPSYVLYFISRIETGDFAHISLSERAKLVAAEWKALAESEKKKYNDDYALQREQYTRDYERVYGRPPTSVRKTKTTASAAS